MKKILALSILITVLSSCSHFGDHKGMKCGCDKAKSCGMECKDAKMDKDGKPAECDDCKKVK